MLKGRAGSELSGQSLLSMHKVLASVPALMGHASNPIAGIEVGEPDVQSHPLPHREFKTSLGHMSPCQEKKKTKNIQSAKSKRKPVHQEVYSPETILRMSTQSKIETL